MTGEWLLVETLGDQPAVIAHGVAMKHFVPLNIFLRRNPSLPDIEAAVAETVRTGEAQSRALPHAQRVISTEPVTLSDGRVHAVHLWFGRTGVEPPQRPVPGPAKWDLTTQVPTVSEQSLINAGLDAVIKPHEAETLSQVFPSREYSQDDASVLAMSIAPEAGRTYCTTWKFDDTRGQFRETGVAGRILLETFEDGSEHLIGRGINIVIAVLDERPEQGTLAKRIIEGSVEPGSYRGIMDLRSLTLLKWIDEPCPLFDWRQPGVVHPDDESAAAVLLQAVEEGSGSAVVRLPANDGGWQPIHVTLNRVELEPGVYAGLVTMRTPSADELADVGL